MQVGVFTKSFQEWPIPVACHRFREMGLDGLDLTVRRRGHIEPADAPTALPVAARAAAEAGTRILFLTTDIVDPTPEAENLLAAARDIGIDRIKLGYYRSTQFGGLQTALDETRRRLEAVVKMCGKYNILPCMHIHSGPYLPSHGTLAYIMVKEFAPNELGVYADMLHMALEGALGGWRQGLELVAPWLALVSVKNHAWRTETETTDEGERPARDRSGQIVWKNVTCPLADGIAPMAAFVAALEQLGYDGVYSLHSEYKGKHSFKDLSTEECYQQTADDFEFFKRLL